MGILGEVSEGFSRIFFPFPVATFKMVVSDWSVPGQLVLAPPTWRGCFPGPGAGTQLRPRCGPQGGDLLSLAVNCWPVCSSICLGFPILLAKKISQLLPVLPQMEDTQVGGTAKAKGKNLRLGSSLRELCEARAWGPARLVCASPKARPSSRGVPWRGANARGMQG